MTIGQFKAKAIQELTKTSPSPQLDVQVLMEFSLKLNKTQLLLQRDTEIPSQALDWLEKAISNRATGLPVAYITGQKEFYGLNFHVTPDVLIPKPDTEILVEKAAEKIAADLSLKKEFPVFVCDMCTGSGCIGISVLITLVNDFNIPLEQLPYFVLIDISPAALKIALNNIKSILTPEEQSHICLIHSDLFYEFDKKQGLCFKQLFEKNCNEVVFNFNQIDNQFTLSPLLEQITLSPLLQKSQFDYILTNPPYIPANLVDELLKDGRNEPRLALDGDLDTNHDGLGLIRRLLPQIKNHLKTTGWLIMETGEYNAEKAAALFEDSSFKTLLYKDLEGQLRGFETL